MFFLKSLLKSRENKVLLDWTSIMKLFFHIEQFIEVLKQSICRWVSIHPLLCDQRIIIVIMKLSMCASGESFDFLLTEIFDKFEMLGKF